MQKLHEEATGHHRDLSFKIRCLQQSTAELMEQKAHLIRTLESREKHCKVLAEETRSPDRVMEMPWGANRRYFIADGGHAASARTADEGEERSYDDAAGATTSQLRSVHRVLEAQSWMERLDISVTFCLTITAAHTVTELIEVPISESDFIIQLSIYACFFEPKMLVPLRYGMLL